MAFLERGRGSGAPPRSGQALKALGGSPLEVARWSALRLHLVVPSLPTARTSANTLLQSGDGSDDGWGYRLREFPAHAPTYFHYPAMMVPEMQGRIIDAILKEAPSIQTVLDPFMGSGTVLAESMWRGLDFVGQDVNPLAILLSRVKHGPHRPELLKQKTLELIARAQWDTGQSVDVEFFGRSKWFEGPVARDLARIRRAIQCEPAAWARRFFWVAMAETVRLTCNSRTSTYKLHIRDDDDIVTRVVDARRTFLFTIDRHLEAYIDHTKALEEKNRLQRGTFKGTVVIRHANTAERCAFPRKADLLVTSPPYGDNQSTVPYGQSSYLPLNWIDIDDIKPGLGTDWIERASVIDARSLGGIRNGALEQNAEIAALSPSFGRAIRALSGQPRDRRVRVSAFFRDMRNAIDNVWEALNPGAYMVWTVGNRCVGGRRIRFDEIATEILESKGATSVDTITRNIHQKRMPTRNSVARTMCEEHVLVLRKPGGKA